MEKLHVDYLPEALKVSKNKVDKEEGEWWEEMTLYLEERTKTINHTLRAYRANQAERSFSHK